MMNSRLQFLYIGFENEVQFTYSIGTIYFRGILSSHPNVNNPTSEQLNSLRMTQPTIPGCLCCSNNDNNAIVFQYTKNPFFDATHRPTHPTNTLNTPIYTYRLIVNIMTAIKPLHANTSQRFATAIATCLANLAKSGYSHDRAVELILRIIQQSHSPPPDSEVRTNIVFHLIWAIS